MRASLLLEFVALIALFCSAVAADAVQDNSADFVKVFHKVGVPNTRRDQRLSISLAGARMIFLHDNNSYEIPYARIRNIVLLHANRVYEKTTYLAAVGTGLGAFMIMKKHPVDTVIIDYENERGGKMGIVLQMERGQGAVLTNRLAERGVKIDEPPVIRNKEEK